MLNTFNKSLLSIVMLAACCSGCVSINLTSSGDADENSKFESTYLGSWYGYWICHDPQVDIDLAARMADGKVDERGFYRITETRRWYHILTEFGTLGFVAPVNITWWLEEK